MASTRGRPRPGGRTARTGHEVRRAVLELILDPNVERMLVADIAARSGVHASTIYRRWGSVERLMLDVALERLGAVEKVEESASLREGLLSYARRVAAATAGPDGFALLRAIIAAVSAGYDADDSGLIHLARRGAEVQDLLARHSGHDLELTDVFDGILAPIYLRVLFDIGGITDEWLTELVDRLLGAPAGDRLRG